jgi:hypothetical protein
MPELLSQAEDQNVLGAELGLRYQLMIGCILIRMQIIYMKQSMNQKVDYIPLAPDFTLQLED